MADSPWDIRATATAFLARLQVAELTAAARDRAAELRALEWQLADLERLLPWWERVLFPGHPDAGQVAELKRRIAIVREQSAAASEQARRAQQSAARELPPMEIAATAEQLIERVLSEPALGRIECEDDEELAAAFEALAGRVASIWVVGFDSARFAAGVAQRIGDPARAADTLGELRSDERLAYAPITLEELIARAASQISAPAYLAARERLQREAAEHAAAAAALRNARAELDPLKLFVPPARADQRPLADLAAAVSKEHQELFAASEEVFRQIEHALTAFPPMTIHAAATAVAGVLRARIQTTEHSVGLSGAREPLAGARAVLLATLAALRSALERVFPGLTALVSGLAAGGDPELWARLGRRPVGPYRERPLGATDRSEPLRPDEAEALLADALERGGIGSLLARVLAHAVMLGQIARASRDGKSHAGWAEGLTFWPESAAELGLGKLAARAEWHRGMVIWLMRELCVTVDRAALEQPLFRVRNALHPCVYYASMITSDRGNIGSTGICRVYYQQEALAALSTLTDEIARAWGLHGDRAQLAHDIAVHLRSTEPAPASSVEGTSIRALSYDELVPALAEKLRNSAFISLEERLRNAARAYQQAIAESQAAAAQVTLWDELLFFTKTASREQRDAWRAEVKKIAAEINADFAQADQLLDEALLIYPPAALYFQLWSVRIAVMRIYATKSSSYAPGDMSAAAYCTLVGKQIAEGLLRAWISLAQRTLGRMPSNDELLEWFVGRELDHRASGRPFTAAASLHGDAWG